MDAFFYEEQFMLETTISIYENKVNNAMIEYLESYADKHYVSDNKVEKFINSVKLFFKKLIITLKEISINIKREWDEMIRSESLKSKLKTIKKKLIAKQLAGEKTCKSKDVEKYKNTYLKMTDNLFKELTKIHNKKYTSVRELDEDLDRFESVKKKYEAELDKIADTEITVSIDSAIRFISSEMTDHSVVFKTIDDCITRVNEISSEVEKIEFKRKLLNSDVLQTEIATRRIMVLEKTCSKISLFLRKAVSKFLAVFVFLFSF